MKRLGIVLALLLMLATTAQAGVGWYLLKPYKHTDSSGVSVLVNLRLTEWMHEGSYDSARECQEAFSVERDRAVMASVKDHLHAGKMRERAERSPTPENLRTADFADGVARASDGISMQASYSRCIASDDPRLGGK